MFRSVSSRVARVGVRTAAPLTLTRSMSLASSFKGAKKTRATAIAGAFLLTTGVSVSLLQAQETKVNLEKIRKEIVDLIDDDPAIGPTLVRLAWHSSGTYNKHDHSGGSVGGTIRHKPEIDHGGNAGLHIAITRLESVKKRHPEISYADLFVYAGVVAIAEMGGPEVPFHLGRKDAKVGELVTPDDRLPNADMGSKPATISHVRDVFYRMGFNDREIVALIGAHAIGRCYPTRSGYSGPWTRAETTFSNEYFRELLENKWTIKKWKGPEQYEDPSGDLMMLPADMAFIWDPQFKKYVELYAKDEELWHKDFAKAFQKLTENGCKFEKTGWRRYIFFGPRGD
ncbi:cytochrome c peroxidase, mitochondrial precursor [Thraustotheca clavata]|uniref:Cytochrome c peroxidase, mitochondrial n=1 Tax=Thraustotheca clavata TaxID=74557 RepID=A0A1V9ZW74_9STRA|nr:cytochrome c peroxidase, mitochondrial precursor [Thraustotheca clavata]